MNPVFVELKQIIASSGMTTYDIAWKAGLTRQTIKLWMDGKTRSPDLASLVAVAKVFGRHVELADGVVHLVADTPATVAAKMSRAREFIGLWRRYQ